VQKKVLSRIATIISEQVDIGNIGAIMTDDPDAYGYYLVQ
jgi:hypothetical protein